jgi:hypothetical protein
LDGEPYLGLLAVSYFRKTGVRSDVILLFIATFEGREPEDNVEQFRVCPGAQRRVPSASPKSKELSQPRQCLIRSTVFV